MNSKRGTTHDKGRTYRKNNPGTGEAMTIAARKAPKFTASKALKDAI
jgi:nucleoid DNA-binding protein